MISKKSFTLIEAILVVVIVGILATLAGTHFRGLRQKALDEEAQANLRVIYAAELVHRMESNDLGYVGCATTALCNTNLHLSLPANNPSWNYSVTLSGNNTDFCAEARRNINAANIPDSWYICAPVNANRTDEPSSPGGTGGCPGVCN